MTDTDTYQQLVSSATAMFLARRNAIAHAESGKGSDARPETWFHEQRNRLDEMREIGKLLRLIAEHGAEFDVWRAKYEAAK